MLKIKIILETEKLTGSFDNMSGVSLVTIDEKGIISNKTFFVRMLSHNENMEVSLAILEDENGKIHHFSASKEKMLEEICV